LTTVVSGFSRLRGWTAEDPGTVFGDGDGVFEVRGHAAVSGHRRPLVIEHIDLVSTGVYHRFDGDHKPGFETLLGIRFPMVRDRRVLVHAAADAMSDELSDD
jgi:hypothetical protein